MTGRGRVAGDHGQVDSADGPIVVVPAHPATSSGGGGSGGRGDLVLEVRVLTDGRRALPVFTSPTRLAAELGPYQPWAALPLSLVRQQMARAGVDVVALDPHVGVDAARWSEPDLATAATAAAADDPLVAVDPPRAADGRGWGR